MKSRIIVGLLLMFAILSPSAAARSHARVTPARQWAIVEFPKTTSVSGVVMNAGRYVVMHDAERMARGQPCTSFWGFGEDGNGEQEEAVSFHCIPRDREVVAKTKLTMTTLPGNTYGCTYGWSWSMDKLVEYQFAGDQEGHGVPDSDEVEHIHE
jgi:hypothetical protein